MTIHIWFISVGHLCTVTVNGYFLGYVKGSEKYTQSRTDDILVFEYIKQIYFVAVDSIVVKFDRLG